MRRVLSLAFACTIVVFGSFARAQQVDIAVGGSTVWSFKQTTDSVGYLPPALKGGVYPSASVEYINLDNRFGINAEGSFRYHEGLYNGFQEFRPVFYDINAVFAPRINKKMTGEILAGAGGETLIFYNTFGNCRVGSGCLTNINSNHFALHFGGGVRYYFWRNLFARPEVHWYLVPNNTEFHSKSVFRYGASIGYTFGPR